jgi:hypothetical protein
MTHLLAHAESRGGLDSGARLLRYATGKPITARRYDYLWNRLGEHLPWVKTQQVTAHWIRHTILTWVERRFGFAVAQAYAGHQDAARGARAMSATGTYVRAGLPEVATALAVLTGESHPLAPEGAHVGADGSPKSADERDHPASLRRAARQCVLDHHAYSMSTSGSPAWTSRPACSAKCSRVRPMEPTSARMSTGATPSSRTPPLLGQVRKKDLFVQVSQL